MPYKFETQKLKIPRDKKKNIKISLEDRETIKRLHKTGEYSQSRLAEMFNCSRKLIYLYIDESGERFERSKEQSRERNKKYPSRYVYENIKRTRRYKKQLYDNGELIGEDNGKQEEN